jgi:predicted MPP superfamily phosphohydrolase
MKTLLLNISDIHVGSEDKPENEGLVLSKFLSDVEEQIQKFEYDECFVLISGDLVFAASDDSYNKFDRLIIQELIKVLKIDRNHFIITPGNHDVAQKAVKDVEDSFIPIFEAKYEENNFNDLLRKHAQHGILFDKFDAFHRYIKDTMKNTNYSMCANVFHINDIWSVHTLNTAILSCGAYKKINDQGHLGIDTRSLQDLIANDNHPKKILLMHHPEYFCMDWVKHELRKLYGQEYALVLSGHTHDQDIFFNNEKGYIHCEAPQLFTDKYDDILGYNYIELEDDKVMRITYREWFEKRNKFRVGISFTEDDDNIGVVSFEDKPHTIKTVYDEVDSVTIIMQERLRKEMQSYIGQPYIWVERYLSDDRIDRVFKIEESSMYSELDIIKKGENIHVVAPSQYGLTCYGSHFLLTLWENQHEFGIKIDADGIKANRFERMVEYELDHYGKTEKDVKWIVIDNWKPFRKDQKGISTYIKQHFPDAHLLLMTAYHESEFIDGQSFDETVIESKTLYLTPLKRAQERLMVDAYNKVKFIDDSDEVLSKLDEDIKNFNLHRSPHSCVTLLTVFKDSFDKNPVNRTDVLENILNIIFDNTRLPNYKSNKPDAKDCDFCLGYFCSKLIKKTDHFFTRQDFIAEIKTFCKQQDYDIDVEQLFDILCFNKIIIDDHNYFKFHFTFWVYYFVASWMKANEEYAKEILTEQRYLHYPEVLEFYTGKDRRRKDAVETIINDLSVTSKAIQAKTNMNDEDDPFDRLQFSQTKEHEDAIYEKIKMDVMQANIPMAIKDQVADQHFNPSAAFHQNIFKVYSDYSVGYLVNIIRIGSKVLRNSDQLDANIKQRLLAELTSAMKVLSNIIYLVSPLFAKQGYILLTDYGLKLTKEFFELEEKERTIRIYVTIPYNLTIMFKEDIFSSKLSPVFISSLAAEKDKVKRHLLASLLVYKQPAGWRDALLNYMETIGSNSYYMGTLLELMLAVLQNGELEEPEQMRMKNLIKAAMFKSRTGRLPESLGELNKIELTKKLIHGEKDETSSDY